MLYLRMEVRFFVCIGKTKIYTPPMSFISQGKQKSQALQKIYTWPVSFNS